MDLERLLCPRTEPILVPPIALSHPSVLGTCVCRKRVFGFPDKSSYLHNASGKQCLTMWDAARGIFISSPGENREGGDLDQ